MGLIEEDTGHDAALAAGDRDEGVRPLQRLLDEGAAHDCSTSSITSPTGRWNDQSVSFSDAGSAVVARGKRRANAPDHGWSIDQAVQGARPQPTRATRSTFVAPPKLGTGFVGPPSERYV